MMRPSRAVLLGALLAAALSVSAAPRQRTPEAVPSGPPGPAVIEVDLATDLSGVSLRQAEVLKVLVDAARVIDVLYAAQIAEGGFYPADMGRAEFEAWRNPGAASPHTLVRRDPSGALEAIPYHEAWRKPLGRVARLLAQAGHISPDPGLRNYLTLAARALITGDYRRAEAAWLATRDSDLDVLIGPIGTDDDREYGLKAAFGAYIMLRDWEWGARLAGFAVFLPEIQANLPVSDAFRREIPDVGVKLAVYDLIYQAGYGGPAPIGAAAGKRVGLGNEPRRLQLRNVMRARFEAQVRPVADAMVASDQRNHVGFDAFFLNSMLQEMAQALGMKDTVTGKGPVRDALGEHADTLEEAKAAVLSLWMADWLYARGELPGALLDHYASFLAGAFRTLHADAGSPAGQARMLMLNHFRDWGAIRRDAATGKYRIEMAEMRAAVEALAASVLTVQGSGDYEGAAMLIDSMAAPRADLRADLERVLEAGVPVEITFRQDEHLLGL
jgi:hypothetical protein